MLFEYLNQVTIKKGFLCENTQVRQMLAVTNIEVPIRRDLIRKMLLSKDEVELLQFSYIARSFRVLL